MRVKTAEVRAVLTDIEGTTSSIAFVKDVLFPYSREHLPDYVRQHAGNADVQRWLDATAREAGIDDPRSPRVIDALLRWIDEDRKTTPLKALQGMVWKAGYEARHYRAHIYPDVEEKLSEWKARGLRLYVYSSGSVAAQRLFFGHSVAGDLSLLFDGWFDTTVGGKRERSSYLRISEMIGMRPPAIVFLSDLGEELDAARGAGMQTVRVCRPPEACPEATTHPCAPDFDSIVLG